ncbi:MAG: hypothetical protein C0467_29755 [Planctomycetaceae bacterium]|nr:hypothetical protein [Planctomycetaceae bacterium]
MTTYEKLAAILAAVQTDPGNRGLARDPHDNLFTATRGDFEAACRSLAAHREPEVVVVTGFYIPGATPPAYETDGPLGAAFLARALIPLGASFLFIVEQEARPLFRHASIPNVSEKWASARIPPAEYDDARLAQSQEIREWPVSHLLALERVGPGTDGHCRNMRGLDISSLTEPADRLFRIYPAVRPDVQTIGIGDGGNEIGMGKIPHDTIVKNIPNGDLIHCRVPTDHLIVAGVSNWGAYALAAGVYVLRGVKPPSDLFDPNREREILEVMVREGPLVDGVTGKQTATVDGLTWDEYVKPLIRIREILGE